MTAPGKKTSKLLSLIIICFILLTLWMVAPLILPMYRWIKVDFPALAAELKVPEPRLRTVFNITVRYAPRSPEDPMPWQLLKTDPAYDSVYPDADREDRFAQRITLISDRDASPPSKMRVGSLYQDRYFTAKAWRFPGGTFGFYKDRPVVMYDAFSLDKLFPGEANIIDYEITNSGKWDLDGNAGLVE